jgi:hypothetical protein
VSFACELEKCGLEGIFGCVRLVKDTLTDAEDSSRMSANDPLECCRIASVAIAAKQLGVIGVVRGDSKEPVDLGGAQADRHCRASKGISIGLRIRGTARFARHEKKCQATVIKAFNGVAHSFAELRLLPRA